MGRPAKKYKKRQNTHRVVDPKDFHLDAAGRVNRKIITPEVWGKLLDHYRQYPGDHLGAKRAADVSYNTARNAWEQGYKRADRSAIKEIVAREVVDIQRELVDLRRLSKQDIAHRDRKAKGDLVDDKALEVRLLRVARGNAVAALTVGSQLLRMALSLTQRLSDMLDDPNNTFTPGQVIKMVGSIIRLNHAATESAGITTRMQRDMLGGPEVLVQVAQMTPDAAVKTIEDGQRTLRRLRERMAEDDGLDAPTAVRMLDTVIVDSDGTEGPAPQGAITEAAEGLEDEEPEEPVRNPPPTARCLTLAASKNLQDALYEDSTQTLWVTFASGYTYRYADVPKDVIDEWEGAPSAGKFFAASVKLAYQYEQLD